MNRGAKAGMEQKTMTEELTLADYGWGPHFEAQLGPEELETAVATRVLAVHRNGLDVSGPTFEGRIPLLPSTGDDGAQATVGDWLIIDPASRSGRRILARKTLFKRHRPAGGGRTSSDGWRAMQLIAANLDTLFVVSSCNQDFNPARLERYLALAREAGIAAIVVLTKADLLSNAAPYITRATALLPGLRVIALDARSDAAAVELAPWVARGQTVTLIGSSGVGKSTLLNTLSGAPVQATAPIRETDAQGRHTTSRRSLHRLPSGGWFLDTPGMREVWLAGADAGIEDVFADLIEIARECRFSDCRHEAEPDCAVKAAIAVGELDPGRLQRYRKLTREDAHHAETLGQARLRSRAFGKHAKAVKQDKKLRRED